MPLSIQLPDAANPIKRKYRRYFSEAERIFQFTQEPVDFISNGIVSNDQFTSVLDGDPILRRFRNMTINAGHIVTPSQRCKGMYLLIEGDLTVNGILSMTARGANAPGKFVGIDPFTEIIYFNETDIFSTLDLFTIGKLGGLGVLREQGSHGQNNACGAGGAGGDGNSQSADVAHIGGYGTAFSGGPGSGGFVSAPDGQFAGYPCVQDGGQGGNGRYYGGANPGYGGGGAGNPGGTGYQAGTVGTGGLIILIVKGNIIFGTNGKIESKGSKGGNSKPGVYNRAYVGGGGGGSGGGAIHLFHRKPFSDLTKFDISGGLGGVSLDNNSSSWSSVQGKNGGNGSLTINQI